MHASVLLLLLFLSLSPSFRVEHVACTSPFTHYKSSDSLYGFDKMKTGKKLRLIHSLIRQRHLFIQKKVKSYLTHKNTYDETNEERERERAHRHTGTPNEASKQ